MLAEPLDATRLISPLHDCGSSAFSRSGMSNRFKFDGRGARWGGRSSPILRIPGSSSGSDRSRAPRKRAPLNAAAGPNRLRGKLGTRVTGFWRATPQEARELTRRAPGLSMHSLRAPPATSLEAGSEPADQDDASDRPRACYPLDRKTGMGFVAALLVDSRISGKRLDKRKSSRTPAAYPDFDRFGIALHYH